MSDPSKANTSFEMYWALAQQSMKDPASSALIHLLFRLMAEVEAMRETLSSPEVPEAVRESYRKAYARIAVLSHNAAGLSGGAEKVMRRFVPREESAGRFSPELEMLARLGASEEERRALHDKMEEVEMYT